MRRSDNIVASRAATQSTPGAIVRSMFGSGPTPRGKRLTTMAKNTSGVSTSALRRQATARSRQNTQPAALSRLGAGAFDIDLARLSGMQR